MSATTIVALATPEGVGGLAVIRLSGPDAPTIARRVFTSPGFDGELISHRAVYGILHTPTDSAAKTQAIDGCLALPFLAPRSYTGEDTVEFHCHGGRAVARLALAACREAGAVPAGPGEFTRRAFLHGKLSLDQAEAVVDLIEADSAHAARGALSQLRGGLDRQLAELERPLLDLLARLEGALEFVSEEEVETAPAAVTAELDAALARVDGLLAMAPAGRLLRDGVQVVLVGEPNVGKSSLFNALVGEARAIVDTEPGTTRDVVSARVEWDGVLHVFHDTAGLREPAGRVEGEGIARTRRQVADADIVLSLAADGEFETLPPTDAAVLKVGTKADQGCNPAGADVVTSSVEGRGLDALRVRLAEVVDERRVTDAVASGVVLNERHINKLEEFRAQLAAVRDLGVNGAGAEVVGSLLAAALGQLGEVSGRVFTEQLLEAVFHRFCVGK